MIYLDEFSLDQIATNSEYTRKFEQKVAEYINIDPRYVFATNSGTSALHLSLLAAGVKPGDDVVVPVLTYGASANAIKYVGANPVFVDVNKDTWLADFDYELFDDGIYKFVMPVDLYGNICNLIPNVGVKNIVDAAESFGIMDGETDEEDLFICYSFNGNKILSTGAGGLIVCENDSYMANIRCFATQGKSFDYYNDGLHMIQGYNYRMAGINAKYGIQAMYRIDNLLDRKEKFHEIYEEQLSDIVTFQKIDTWSNYWMNAVLLPETENVRDIMYALKLENIPTRRVFRPLNHSEPFKDGKTYPVAEMIYNRGLCLPSSCLNTADDIYHVCEVLKKILKG
jgi:perosamine synthetase